MSEIIRPDTCRTCRFKFVQGGDIYCRWEPPKSQAVIVPDTLRPYKVLGQVATWPKVEPDWWCGQHRGAVARETI